MGSHNSGPFFMMSGGSPQHGVDSECCCRHTMVPGAGCSCENPTDVVWCLVLGGIVAGCSIVVESQTVGKSSSVPQKCWGWKQARGVKAFRVMGIDFSLLGGQGEKACFCHIAQVKATKDFRCSLGTSHQY